MYATVVKTPLVFRQIVGRFVRVTPGLPNDASFLLIPADPVLRQLAAEGMNWRPRRMTRN